MKIFMHWDMEGTSGLFTREQTWYWEAGVREEVAAEGKKLLMDDISSACAAALAAGADEVIVCDTHHGGGNIQLEKMLADPRITYLVQSRGPQADGRFRWMPGLDETVDAFMLPGHHAKAGTPNAFLPHTWTFEWSDFRINGQSVGEMGIEACFAGHWDVPVVLAQGDEACCSEAEAQFPGIVVAPVKRAVSHDVCTGPNSETARRLTADKIAEAIAKLRAGMTRPFKPALPMIVTVRLTSVPAADKATARPGVRRVDEYTVESIVERHCDVVKWINGTGLNMPPPTR